MVKNVLIITYYWPPSGGAGVQRWLKFVKYLRYFGWEPIVYTPSNGEIPVEDLTLLKDIPENITVIKRPIWEPYSVYKMLIGQKKNEKINTGFLTENKKPRLTEKLSVWIRGNFFIPDARKFWVKPSIKFLRDYLKKNPVDVIISSGPPHSMHLIALGLKRKLNIPWLADFRDPWTNIDFYKDLMLTSSADKKHHKMELEVIMNADAVVSIGETISEEFKSISSKSKVQSSKFDVSGSSKELNSEKFEVITNGFDEEDVYTGEIVRDKKFSIAHIGTMVKSRNPEVLWKVLAELVKADKNFAADLEIKLVGKVDVNVNQSIAASGLTQFVNKIDYLSHAEIVKFQQASQVLLLIVNNTKNAKGILTGKFFEYLSAKRPILCIGPDDGEVAKILRETNSGKVAGYEDYEILKKQVLEYYLLYKEGQLQINSSGIEKYSRKELTGKLAGVLASISH